MKSRHPLLTGEELAQLAEIDRLLDEAYAHYFEFGDGICKSSEAGIDLGLGNYWDRADEVRYTPKVTIYSYVLGPHRGHDFDSIEQALEVVRHWHHREMTHDYHEEDFTDEADDPYLEIERQRREEFEKFYQEMDAMCDPFEEGDND